MTNGNNNKNSYAKEAIIANCCNFGGKKFQS